MIDNKLVRRFLQLFLIILPAIFVAAIYFIKQGNIAFFEYIACYITPFIAWPIRFISNLLPFSLTELAAFMLPLSLFFIVLLVVSRGCIWLGQTLLVVPRLFNNKYMAYWRSKTLFYWTYIGKLLFVFVCIASYVVSSYLLFHGFNYERETIASKLALSNVTVNEADLKAASNYVVRQLSLITKDAFISEMPQSEKEASVTADVALPSDLSSDLPSKTKSAMTEEQAETSPSSSNSTEESRQTEPTESTKQSKPTEPTKPIVLADEAAFFAEPASELDVNTDLDASFEDENDSYLAAPLTPAFTKETANTSATEKSTTETKKITATSQASEASQTTETTSETTTVTSKSKETLATTVSSDSLAQTQTQVNNSTFTVPDSNKELFAIATSAYRQAARKYHFLDGQTLTLKPVSMSYYWSFTHTTGMYMPLFMEANVNVSQLPPFLLFTAAHELAHQRFFAREDEANFLAFLTLSFSKNQYANYSAFLNAWNYLAKDLYLSRPELVQKLYADLPAVCKQDLELESLYWQQFSTKVAIESQKINDKFIQANGDERGVKAYDEVSKLIVAYLKATDKIKTLK